LDQDKNTGWPKIDGNFDNKKALDPPKEISFVSEKCKRGVKGFLMGENYR
jgi:hypothetical protein